MWIVTTYDRAGQSISTAGIRSVDDALTYACRLYSAHRKDPTVSRIDVEQDSAPDEALLLRFLVVPE